MIGTCSPATCHAQWDQDSLMEWLYARCRDEGVPIGGGRTKTASSYADDLKALAVTAAGLQRIIDAVRMHSWKYGWTLNVKKTLVIIFGTPAQRAALAQERFHWGAELLQRADTVKYLGVHLHADLTWRVHVAQAVRKGWATYYTWAPVLASTRIHVATKIRLLNTYLRPVMEYAAEIWGIPLHVDDNASLQELDTVLTAACRLACGIRATPTEVAWQRRAGVKPHVMMSEMGMLPATDMARMACLRYAERVRVADAHACTLAQHDAASPLFLAPLPANRRCRARS